MSAYLTGRYYKIRGKKRMLWSFVPCEFLKRRNKTQTLCQYFKCKGRMKFKGIKKTECGYSVFGKIYKQIKLKGR